MTQAIESDLTTFWRASIVSGLWLLTGAGRLQMFTNLISRILGYRLIWNSVHMDTCRILSLEQLGSTNNFGKQLCDKLQTRLVMLWAQRPCWRNRFFDMLVVYSSWYRSPERGVVQPGRRRGSREAAFSFAVDEKHKDALHLANRRG